MKVVAVLAPDQNASFARSLTDALSRAGARVERRPSDQAFTVKILEDEAGERVLSVSARGVPEEYELFHRVRYEVREPSGPGIPATTMTVTRDYRFDETELLSKRKEAAFLQTAMVDDLVGTVMRRLRQLSQ